MDVADCISNSVAKMEYYKARLKTFDVYPKQMLPDKFQLARAGLFLRENRTFVNVFGVM